MIPAWRQQQLRALSIRLASAWEQLTQIDTLAPEELPANREEAYFVQDEMSVALDLSLAGWKVGATSAKMRELDGHDDVIPGRIFAPVTYVGTQVVLPTSRFPDARAETEFAFRLSADVSVRDKPWRAEELAPLVTLHPAIEIIGNRHVLPDATAPVRSLMTIADNGGGIGFVFGEPTIDWREIDFQHHDIRLQVDGGTPAENFLGDMRCIPIQAFADLVNHLRDRGIGLHAGDFVSTGAATVPQPIRAGSHVVADFGTIGKIEITFE